MPKIADIIREVNDFAPLGLQESWDNSGIQVGSTDIECTGVMICVDVTPDVISEAGSRGCNLIISHHPLLFKGLKQICPGDNVVQQSVIEAIRRGITVYSSHTALDSASHGISYRIVRMLGAEPLHPLVDGPLPSTGLGCVAEFERPVGTAEFCRRVRTAMAGSGLLRCSDPESKGEFSRIAVCGGSGGEFIPKAIEAGCGAYLTSDVRYHDFVDYGKRIFLVDIGHFDSEKCAKQIFYEIISEKFHNFAIYKSETERNPIYYL